MRHRTRAFAFASTAAAAWVGFAAPQAAYAEATTYKFDIPAQDLGGALRSYALATHQQVAFDSAALGGRQSPALVGAFTAPEGLSRLLSESGLTALRTPGGAIVVRRADASTIQNIAYVQQPTADAASVAASAPAQEGAQLEEIVITAQRVEENLQRAAISVTAIGSQQLANAGVTNVNHLTQLVPALRTVAGQGPYTNFNLRGVTNRGVNAFADPAVITMVDGVPLSHPTSSHGLFYDLQRVEVLKGPQGILYGRNASGGVVNVLSNRPDPDFGGSVSLDVGSFDKTVIQGVINVPFNNQLAGRIAAQSVKRDGYRTDGTDDEDANAIRGSLKYDPNDDLSLTLIADWSHQGGKGTGATPMLSNITRGLPGNGLIYAAGAWDGALTQLPQIQNQYIRYGLAPRTQQPFQDNTYWGVTLEAVWQTPIGALTIIPSHRETGVYFLSTLPSFYFGEDSTTDQNSLEVRLSSRADRRLRYLVGGFYLDDEIHSHQAAEQVAATTNVSNQGINNWTETWAIFGNLTFSLTDTFRISGGVRYTDEKRETNSTRYVIPNWNFATRSITPFPALGLGNADVIRPIGSKQWQKTNYRFNVEWEPRQDSLLYANVGTGFKAGGFFFGPLPNTYEPEEVTAYTVGAKNQFLDKTLQVNVEAFQYDYKNQQVSRSSAVPGFGNILVTDNVGKATIKGVEIESKWLATEHTLLGATVQYLNARYDRYTYQSAIPVNLTQGCALVGGNIFRLDCSGKRMSQSPEWIIMGSIEQTFPLADGAKVVANLNIRWEDERMTSSGGLYLPENYVDGYTRTNAFITYHSADEAWSVSAYVDNIEDDEVIVETLAGRSYSIATGGVFAATLQAPRTYGVRVNAKF